MALLLGHRGSRSRSRSGFGHSVIRFVDKLLGRMPNRSRRRNDRAPGRRQQVSVWVLLVGVLVAFGGGFLIGGRFGGPGDGTGSSGLQANGTIGRSPAFVGEVDTRPLAPEAFIVSAYPDMPAADAKARAVALANYLEGRGLAKARPYPYPLRDITLWVVAVYFDGPSEAAGTRDLLAKLPADVPDEMFVRLRNTEAQWPKPWPIR